MEATRATWGIADPCPPEEGGRAAAVVGVVAVCAGAFVVWVAGGFLAACFLWCLVAAGGAVAVEGGGVLVAGAVYVLVGGGV
jgi:hypothetical protein